MLVPRLSQGFSMVELLVTMVVAAILLSVGVPSFNHWMQNNKIRTASDSMMSGLQLARAEAVKRNRAVLFILRDPGNDDGEFWRIEVLKKGAETANEVVQTTPQAETKAFVMDDNDDEPGGPVVKVMLSPAGAKRQVKFNGLGRLSTDIKQINVDVSSKIMPADQSRDMRIQLESGQISMCDPNATGSKITKCN